MWKKKDWNIYCDVMAERRGVWLQVNDQAADTPHVPEQELDEKNKNHMLSAGSLKTPLPYHTPISSQEVG